MRFWNVEVRIYKEITQGATNALSIAWSEIGQQTAQAKEVLSE